MIFIILFSLLHNTLGNFQNIPELLSYVNSLRYIHNSDPVTYNNSLASGAQTWADYLANINTLVHSNPKNQYGENLAQTYISSNWKKAIDMWYSENIGYNYSNNYPDFSRLHFTALVWSSTKSIGFGLATNYQNLNYYVIRFYPPGNLMGYFTENVFPDCICL